MRFRRFSIVALLATHAALLAWQGWRHSPTPDEVAHLPAGFSHWTFGRFDLYRVNPPLVRLLASAPLVLDGPKTDWNAFTEARYARPEFGIGRAFAQANGFDTFWYFTIARWACIPISLIGGGVCYCWSRDLYGVCAGLVALALWCFCPNILGNAAQITPDAPAAAMGVAAGYFFWRWLRAPTWPAALLAGLMLGLVELTKSTWIVLFGLWPLLWIGWHVCGSRRPKGMMVDRPSRLNSIQSSIVQFIAIFAFALYLLNLGYAFEHSFQRLDSFRFISRALGGPDAHATPGNRFAGQWFGAVPVPVPENYLLGIDVQRFDFEKGKWSYLRGVQQEGGWWYYYLYAMLVKLPIGTLCLLGLTCILKVTLASRRAMRQPMNEPQSRPGALGAVARLSASHNRRLKVFDEVALLAPAVIVITLVSSQTGFNRYLRYVLPAFPFLFIWASQAAERVCHSQSSGGFKSVARLSRVPVSLQWPVLQPLTSVFLAASTVSSLAIFPHSLSYFNELAGGPRNGPAHLLDANIDWGQDLLYLKRWYVQHPDARPFHLAWFGFIDPSLAGIQFAPVPQIPDVRESPDGPVAEFIPPPGWYAISINELYGYNHIGHRDDDYAWLRRRRPVAYVGYSALIYEFPLHP
jgi:hypothetical protein